MDELCYLLRDNLSVYLCCWEDISESLISLSETSIGGERCPFNKSSLVLHRLFCTISPLIQHDQV